MSYFLVYYKTKDEMFNTYDGAKYVILNKIPYDCPTFELLPGFKPSNIGLKKFYNKWKQDTEAMNEFRENNDMPVYDIFKGSTGKGKFKTKQYFKTSHTLTLDYFKFNCNKGRYSFIEELDKDEQFLTEKTYNAGIQYGEPGEYDNISSYDYTMYYPRLMTELDIPTEPGHYIEFTEIPKKPAYGYYNCRINVVLEKCTKFFRQKKIDDAYTNWHTHFDLMIAMKLQNFIPGSVTIEPLGRAYIYDDLISGKSIFNKWYVSLLKMKKELKGNIAVKKLSSSLWGYLVQTNIIRIDEEEAEDDYDLTLNPDQKTGYLIVDYKHKLNGEGYYKLHDLSKPYQKFPFRLKSFLPAYGRYMMVKRLLCQIDYIVRIHTDGFMMTRPLTVVEDGLKYEPDKSGYVEIYANNRFEVWSNDS